MAINSVSITGNLCRDPELRATQSGMQVLSFTVAVNERRKNQQTGEWYDEPVFVDCTMFGNRAESVSNYLSCGSKVSVSGKLHYSHWEKDGQKRSKLDVTVNEIEFMSRQNANNQSSVPVAPTAPSNGYNRQSVEPMMDVYDEDIPF